MGKVRGGLVLVAGLLAGVLGLGMVLALSGLRISRTPWDPESGTPPGTGGPQVIRPETVPVPEVPQQPQAVPPWLSRVHLGPVPGDVATDLVGELTLGGYGARVRVVSVESRSLRVVSAGPYPQTTIDEIVALVRRKFPKVDITVVPVK